MIFGNVVVVLSTVVTVLIVDTLFDDGGLVVTNACEDFLKLPPIILTFRKEDVHPLILLVNTISFKNFKLAEFLTKCSGCIYLFRQVDRR